MILNPIAHIRTDFPTKFGIPRQSGVVASLRGRIVFEPPYRNADYIRGLEQYSHVWLIWQFSANKHQSDSPLVRPPRLGGNTHVGVFASRSPYRPNSIGLSAVEITGIDLATPEGPVIYVGGADLLDGTPIFDIKPYLRYADCISEARSGFADEVEFRKVEVTIPDDLKAMLPPETIGTLTDILSNDPRPSYHDDASKTYGMRFAEYDIHFQVIDKVLTVTGIDKK
ncbi:MAG: tRNA (N6-threonylcarbamoyladenosine(37)-N6)-methyltransferase TrmO [Bacteroidales bacterium]|nr:tRNA (N6-threonylcarbamoyladenosine(37)-N6)-methyltransferase TrmO [Bacteroidales bacterium]